MTTYYYFNDYGDCFTEKGFLTEVEAAEYCEVIGAEYFCKDE